MKRNHPKNNFRSASLRGTGSARTVLLRMAADQDRADRIRALKQERPDLTWRRIADHVGVSERAAADWQRKGGIEYENAKKLAEIFEVGVDYIWRGEPSDTPTPFASRDTQADLLDAMEARLMEQADIIRGLLQRNVELLERIEAATVRNDQVATRLADADEEFVVRVAQLAAEAFRPEPETPARARRKPTKSRSPRG